VLPMPTRSRTRTLDLNQLAKLVVDSSTGNAPRPKPPERKPKNKAAVELGKLGGRKGGKARAAKLTAEQRREIARKAAQARWQRAPE
jgi:hypothetical protein